MQLANLTKQYKPVAMFAGHDHVVSYMWDDNFDTAFFISGAGSFSGGCMKSLEAIFRLNQWLHHVCSYASWTCMHALTGSGLSGQADCEGANTSWYISVVPTRCNGSCIVDFLAGHLDCKVSSNNLGSLNQILLIRWILLCRAQ